MSVALIQGAGGSFGSHFARHLLSCTSLNVVAASRNPDATRRTILEGGGLDEKRLSVLEMDVREEGTIEKAAKQVETRFGGASLRILLNVSGVLHADKSVTKVNMEELLHSYQEKGVEDLAKGAVPEGLSVLASLTARVGSIGDNSKGGWIGYRSSKAATNQIIKTLERELALRSTPSVAVALHPGTVVGTALSKDFTKEEDAGKKAGVFWPEESSAKLLDVIKRLGKDDGGRFLDWDGRDIKW